MADSSISVSGPVSINENSQHRVAFDLMKHIASATYDTSKEQQKTKEYWLKLYHQCFRVTDRNSIESVLREASPG